VAAVALDRLGESGEGRTELVEHDGLLELRLSTSGLNAGDGFLEVWVINTDVTQLVSLGPLRNDGTYELPPGLDPASFPIVDVSVEPLDGVPTHSGDSVLRGQLTF
jgi:anti-sigma-K factor RskA